MTGGAAASALGMVLLAAAVAHHHLPVFLAATAISGAGYSLLFFRRPADDQQRGAGRAPRRRALGDLFAGLCVTGCRLAPSRRGGVRARARFRRQSRRGRDRSVQRDHSRFGRDDARSAVSDRYSAEKSEERHMIRTTPEQNKTLVLEAFDTLFNKRDYDGASRFWSDKYVQHSAHIEPGREGLFNLIKALPDSLRYEHGLIL